MATKPAMLTLQAHGSSIEQNCSPDSCTGNDKGSGVCVVVSESGCDIFSGSSASCSFVTTWTVFNASLCAVGRIGPMVGGTRSMALASQGCDGEGSAYRLAVVTLPGLVYVWSVKFEESLEAENSSKRRFIANVLCSIETSSNPTGPISVLDFLQDRETLICAGELPFQSLSMVNSATGEILCLIPGLRCSLSRHMSEENALSSLSEKRLTMWNYTCLKVDRKVSILSNKMESNEHEETANPPEGHLVALGDTNGMLGVLFVTNALLMSLKENSKSVRLEHNVVFASVHKLCGPTITIYDLAFCSQPPGCSHRLPIISMIASDGIIRHWDMERRRLKLAKADATLKAYDARFLCYGPVLPTSLDSPPELLVAVSGEKVLGKHNEEDAPSFMLSAAHQSHALLSWSVFPPSSHNNSLRKFCRVLKYFSAPISGLGCNANCTHIAVLTSNDALTVYKTQASVPLGAGEPTSLVTKSEHQHVPKQKRPTEFGGGLEGLVVGHQKEISLQLDENVLFCRDVIRHIGETWISERKDLFYSPDPLQLKPGVLVLINDSDWDLHGTLSAPLKDGDVISFISTLHGG